MGTLDNDASTALWRQRKADTDSIVGLGEFPFSTLRIARAQEAEFGQGVRIRCSRRSDIRCCGRVARGRGLAQDYELYRIWYLVSVV